MSTTAFCRPTHLTPLEESCEVLEGDLAHRRNKSGTAWRDWKRKVRLGYERLTETLWQVAREFDVRGYGLVLRDKLINKWCECGCSTDHLGEVCERTVREEEEESGIRSGKEREWDGRGMNIVSSDHHEWYKFAVIYQEAESLAGKQTKKRISGILTSISVE